MLKKIASITVAMALAMTSFIGCSSKSDENTNNSTESAETKAGDTKKDEIVTLKYYTIGSEPRDKQMVVDKMNEYLGEKIGVNLDISFIDWGDYNQKSSVMINTGDNFDLMFTCSWAGDYLGNARKGAFLDLTPYLANVGKDMYDAIDPRFWDGAKIDDKVYAVPNQKEIAILPSLVFTKHFVDKYSVPYKDIHNLKDLDPYLKEIKEKETDVTPLYVKPGAWPLSFFFENIVGPVGVKIDDEKLVVQNVYETEELKQDLDFLRDYFEKGYINSDSNLDTNGDDRGEILVTKADGQPYADNIWTKSNKSKGYEYPDVVSSLISEGLVTNGSTQGSMIAVSSNSKHPEKAVEYLNLVNTDPYLRNLINYGIEDVHYEKIGENQIKLLPKSKDYDMAYYTVGNLFITYVLDVDPVDKWDEFRRVNDKAISSKILGFTLDTSPIVNEIAAMGNVEDEFTKQLYSGQVDPEKTLEKLNKKLYQQGLQKVIDEVQLQLDEWKQ